MEIKGLVWVGTATERYDATVAFFRDMLGLSVFHQSPALTVLVAPGGEWVEVFGPGHEHYGEFDTGPGSLEVEFHRFVYGYGDSIADAKERYDSYTTIYLANEAPEVEVHLIPSTERPGGAGEATNPSIIPAVVNAIYAATGKRIRSVPIRPADLA